MGLKDDELLFEGFHFDCHLVVVFAFGQVAALEFGVFELLLLEFLADLR